MKVTLDIDCTPAEARESLGLPDVRPLKTAIFGKLESQMTASLEKLSPDAILRNWFPFDLKGSTPIQDLFASFTTRPGARAEG
jgi:hypothetical protein